MEKKGGTRHVSNARIQICKETKIKNRAERAVSIQANEAEVI